MSGDILFSEGKTELCLDEARRMLHISKRKCSALLREGVLPCTSTGKKTKQYRILRSDVEAFMKTPAFNAKAAKSPTSPEEYRARLEDLWYDAPDVLTPVDVQKLTGSSQSTVSSWMVSGKLRTVIAHGSPIMSKVQLIEFLYRNKR